MTDCDIQPPLSESQANVRETSSESQERVWEAPDYTVSKVVEQEGNHHMELPRFGATCTVQLSAINVLVSSPNGILKEENLVQDFDYSKYFNVNHSGEMQIGNGDSEIDRVLERAVQSMKPGERARVTLRTCLDLKKNSAAPDASAERVTIEARVKLEAVLNAQPIYKWYPETKLEKARELNASAVTLFKTQRFKDALYKFQVVLRLLAFVIDEGRPRQKALSAVAEAENPDPPPASDSPAVSPEILAEAEDLIMTCQSNLAAVHFRWGNYKYVIELATKVLERQPENVKLLYRRGVSYLCCKDFELAKADLTAAHKLDPDNKAINEKLGQLRISEKKYKDQLSSGLRKMFT